MDAPQLTPGSNGYLGPLEQTQWNNPWTGVASADQTYAQTAVQTGQQGLQNMQAQMTATQSMDQPYPTYPNAAGLGSQTPFSGNAQAAPVQGPAAPQGSPSAQGDTSLRGANPWSLQGEANSR